VMIENVTDVHTKIKLVRWNRPAQPESRDRQALQFILASIMTALGARGSEQPVRSHLPDQPEPSTHELKTKDAKIRHRRPPVPASEEVS
jgi:hypothetical protein